MISKNTMIGAIFLLPVILGTTQAFDPFYPFEVATGELKTPAENLGAPWFQGRLRALVGNRQGRYYCLSGCG